MLECQSSGYGGYSERENGGCTPVKEEESYEVGARRGKTKLEPAKIKEEHLSSVKSQSMK